MSRTEQGALHVACMADARYLPYCMVMLRSLFEQARKRPVHVHYLCPPEFAAGHREALERLAEHYGHQIEFVAVPDSAVEGLPPMRHVKRLSWYRVFVPELLPAIERALYLDADLLVLDGLDDLWGTDLEGHLLAAVPNVLDPDTGKTLLPALGLDESARYFNSGVMVMDLRAMRAARFTGRVVEFARNNAARLIWGDQDALNGVVRGAYRPLHPRYNCMNSLFFFENVHSVFAPQIAEEAVRQPAILHFEGPESVKPWHIGSRHPMTRLYRRHLRRATRWLPLPWPRRLVKMAWHALPDALRGPIQRWRGLQA